PVRQRLRGLNTIWGRTMLSNTRVGFLFGVALASGISVQAPAATIFSDNFDSGPLSGWTATSNDPAPASSPFGILLASDHFVSAPNSLEAHLVAVTNGITPLGSNLFVDANHLFTTTNGTYTFTLQDATESCQGCVISARVLVDGIVYATNSGANALLG